MDKVLLIDDQRGPDYIRSAYGIDVTKVTKNYQEGILALQDGPWDMLLLDHDLNSYDDSGKEMTGTDVMKFLQQNPTLMPKDVIFVTANPHGRRNMQAVIDDMKKEKS